MSRLATFGPLAFLMMALVFAGGFIHFGTAFLRLSSFWPTPQLLDFSTIFAGAWAMRMGVSPYEMPVEFVDFLRQETGLPHGPPSAFNPPFLYLIFYPATWFSYPVTGWLWVLINLGILAWSSRVFLRLAGIENRAYWYVVFPAVVSFGPVFLDLTLGQLSTLLLLCALIIGANLRQTTKPNTLLSGLGGMLAVTVKVYPLMWLGVLPFLKRWRVLLVSLVLLVISFGLAAVVGPPGVISSWGEFLQARVLSANDEPGLEDQALVAWLDRMGRSQTYTVPGLRASESDKIHWELPWEFNRELLRLGGYVIGAALAGGVLLILWRRQQDQPETAFYLWVLVSLVVVPHTDRYNHVLLLPGMAVLWSRGKTGQLLVCIAYFLAGLARLTHLWARVLPVPWGPLITGSGLFAVLILIAGLIRSQQSEAAV